MAFPPTSDETLAETVAAYQEHGTQDKAAQALGIDQRTVSKRLKIAAQRGLLLDHKAAMPGYVIHSLAEKVDGKWIKQVQEPGEPGEPFEAPAGHVVKGVSALVDPDGRVRQQWIKTKADTSVPDLVAALKATFAEYEGHAQPVPAPEVSDDQLMSVYPIADQHNGLLAWGRETGESYDLQIGADRLRSAMARLVAQSPASAQAIVLNLGDWQHTDDQRNMTPQSGNLLDVDSRYFKILTAGVRLMMDCIELALQKHNRVLVRNIPGNHDPHASIALTVASKAFYARNPRITVDDDPGKFFFHRFGATLIGAHHGDGLKPDRMAMAMATMRRADWGATKYHWFLFGHIHHETVKEVGDVRCESFQTLAANDAYHAGSGYVAGKSLTSVTLHYTDGEVGRHRVNMPPVMSG